MSGNTSPTTGDVASVIHPTALVTIVVPKPNAAFVAPQNVDLLFKIIEPMENIPGATAY